MDPVDADLSEAQKRKVRPSLRQDGPSNPEPDRDTTQYPYWPQNLCKSDAKPGQRSLDESRHPVSLQNGGCINEGSGGDVDGIGAPAFGHGPQVDGREGASVFEVSDAAVCERKVGPAATAALGTPDTAAMDALIQGLHVVAQFTL